MDGCIRPPIISVLITVKSKARVALIQKVPNGQSVRVRQIIIQSNLQNVKKPAFSCPNGTVISGSVQITESGTYCVDGSVTVHALNNPKLTFKGCSNSSHLTISGGVFGSIISDVETTVSGTYESVSINGASHFSRDTTFNTPVNCAAGITIGGGSGHEYTLIMFVVLVQQLHQLIV